MQYGSVAAQEAIKLAPLVAFSTAYLFDMHHEILNTKP